MQKCMLPVAELIFCSSRFWAVLGAQAPLDNQDALVVDCRTDVIPG